MAADIQNALGISFRLAGGSQVNFDTIELTALVHQTYDLSGIEITGIEQLSFFNEHTAILSGGQIGSGAITRVAGIAGDVNSLVVGGDSVTLGLPTVEGATVAAEVLSQSRGPKVIAFKKRRRKNSRRKRGHRQEYTLVRITEILTGGAKPSKAATGKRFLKKPAAEQPAAAASCR